MSSDVSQDIFENWTSSNRRRRSYLVRRTWPPDGTDLLQIRQDFSCFGEFGQQGYGINVTALRGEIASILGTNRDFSVVLVGVGNIGRALIENFCFEQYGFHMLSAYDVRPELIGKNIGGITIQDISDLPQVFNNNNVDVAVLCVPKSMANTAAEDLVRYGIRAIWNFTNVELNLSSSDIIVENIHFSDSLLALGYYLAESTDQEALSGGKQRK